MDPVQFIRTKTREEWENYLKSKITAFRSWIQDRGEVALIGGLLAGIVFVLLFKLFVGIFVLALLAGFLIWHIALPNEESKRVDDNRTE